MEGLVNGQTNDWQHDLDGDGLLSKESQGRDEGGEEETGAREDKTGY